MSVIIGKKKIMFCALKTFISSTFWSEKIGPACALAFIKKHKKLNVSKKLISVGKKVKNIWINAAKNNNLDISVMGIDPLASFRIESNNWPATLTFFIQEMLKLNILASDKCYANYKHDRLSLKMYENACNIIFEKISRIQKKGNILKELDGPVKEMGFNRLTNKIF